ncbi:piggyBac transposable element-derived protein 4, partial [Trichinella spiralis]|uniref:piggyBac transposable element-derived protein 4 n=1 Tax=Trichinella spiralis TaxID=6334 RepID=UPI0001EFE173
MYNPSENPAAESQATHGICKYTLASRQVELVRSTKGCEWFSTWQRGKGDNVTCDNFYFICTG